MNQPNTTSAPTLYDDAYWEALRYNRGSVPQRVDAARWWDMLAVMYPRNWRRAQDESFELFAVDEPQTADLYTWLVCIGAHDTPTVEYWELIAPDRSTNAGLLERIAKAKEVKKA